MFRARNQSNHGGEFMGQANEDGLKERGPAFMWKKRTNSTIKRNKKNKRMTNDITFNGKKMTKRVKKGKQGRGLASKKIMKV